MMGNRTTRRACLALMLLGAGSCGTAQSPNPFDPSDPTGRPDRIRIEVQNLNFNDASIFAVRQSQRVRVGRVTGKTDQTFTIEWNAAVPISFQIDVVSGRSCQTGLIGVDRDSRVWVTIPSELGLSPCQAGRR